MYSQKDGIYFSHTAILPSPTPIFSASPTADTPTIHESGADEIDAKADDLINRLRLPIRLQRPRTAILSRRTSSFLASPTADSSTILESGEDEVNAKADEFIYRFKQQLRLQRLESLKRYQMIRTRYDVFLSFRGEDTRKTFTGHLYNALIGAGISTFIDNEELPRGETISKELKQAIEGSTISLVVLSENYADSAWCLEELCNIMECSRTRGMLVIPIFYGVDPSEVRKQTGKVAAAFSKHEELLRRSDSRINESESKQKQEERLKRWKAALTEVANCSGWDSEAVGNDAELIKVIVGDILRKTLSTTNLNVASHPVGIYSRAQELRSLLKRELVDDGVRIVGICGMAGMGKTTIAKAIYNMFDSQFGSNRSFLENVRQNWDQQHRRVHLQKQLLFHILKKKVDQVDSVDKGIQVIKDTLVGKRVLVIIDDVDHRDQLNAVAGGRDWYGPGSIIIITTRNQQLLREFQVDATYMVPEMNNIESLELFSWHAFGKKKPNKDYTELSKSVVNYCGGLPLALTVLGSYLKSMSAKSEWISELAKLKKIPHEDVLEKLRISFDGLRDDTVKDIFLDISCFFIGMDMDYVQEILDGCGLYAETGLRRLLERCLITISERNKIMMHDLLRDMGRAIVAEKLTNRPGERSRLWSHEDVSGVLTDGTGTKNIEGLALDMESLEEKVNFSTKAFVEMRRLRLLQLNFVQLTGSYEYLSKNLRWLCWSGFPLTSIPSNFDQRKLVAINLKYSNLSLVWEHPQLLKELKILNLSHSNHLTRTPDFSNLPNLRQLILKYCKKLSEIHHSIGDLDGLILVNLKECEILTKLPRNFYKLKSLRSLILSGCSLFEDLDEDIGEMVSLKILLADNTGLRALPETIGRLTNLTDLSLCGLRASPDNLGSFHFWTRWIIPGKNSKSVNLLPPSLCGLKSLTTLSLMHCNLTDDALPKDLGSLSSLVTLRLDDNSFHNLPSSLKGLSRLRSLSLDNCTLLQSILDLPTNLKALYAANCKALKTMPDVSDMSNLVILELANCHELVGIPGLDMLLKSVSLQLQNKISIATTAEDSFLQVSTTTEFGSLFLHGDDIPGWFTCISNGSSISFEVPPLVGNSFKGCLVRTVYSYSPTRTLFSAFPSVSVANKTQRKSFIFDLIALSHHGTTSEGHLWQGLVSNDELKLKGGDKVEVSLDFGEHYTVNKTGVFLLFGGRVSNQIVRYEEPETSTSQSNQKANNIKRHFDEKRDAKLLIYTTHRWKKNYYFIIFCFLFFVILYFCYLM